MVVCVGIGEKFEWHSVTMHTTSNKHSFSRNLTTLSGEYTRTISCRRRSNSNTQKTTQQRNNDNNTKNTHSFCIEIHTYIDPWFDLLFLLFFPLSLDFFWIFKSRQRETKRKYEVKNKNNNQELKTNLYTHRSHQTHQWKGKRSVLFSTFFGI